MPQDEPASRNNRVVRISLAVIAVSLVLAYANRFIQDDAFISFRYAFNLTEGHGLVWNPGERVEGYTNFLWTILMSVPISLGHDAVVFSQVIGLLSFVGSLLLTFKLSRLVFDSDTAAVLALLLLGTNYTFSAYATGGLETQFQTFLCLAVVYLSLKSVVLGTARVPLLMTVSLLAAAALLTRLDSVLVIGPVLAYLLWRIRRNPTSDGSEASGVVALVLPGAVVVFAWMFWEYSFYGDILPNSYYAKATLSVASLRLGFAYVYHFLVSYVLFPFLLVFPFRAKRFFRPVSVRVLVVTLAFWLGYVVRVGGDFMEFRLLVPVLPYIMALLAGLIVSFNGRAVRTALTLLVIGGSLWHAATFSSVSGISTVGELKGYIEDEDQNWDEIGRSLGTLFGGDSLRVTIATSAAGAIPYYSRLRTVDMLGVNDKWIARNGIVWSPRPGHQRIATHEYMMERGVNLVIGHPRVDPVDSHPVSEYSADNLGWIVHLWMIKPELLPPTAGILEIPVGTRYKVSVLYMVQSDAVDRAIARHRLIFHPFFGV